MIVLGISFDAKDNEGLVVTKVQVLNSRPADIPALQSNSYSVMSIDVGSPGTISEHNAENIIIHFKVSREWIEENDIDVSTIRMARYHGGQWQDLPTNQLREEEEFIHFTVKTPGFSIFSVVGDKAGETISEETPGISVEAEMAAKIAEPESTDTPDTPGFTGILSLVFVTLAFLFIRKNE